MRVNLNIKPMTRFFKGFHASDPGDTRIPPEERIQERDPDSLPFSALSGRRFEVLCYLLKKAQHPNQCTVSLMQGTGDKGRDVIVFKNSRAIEVIQCKNIRNRLTKTELLTELGKLALYHCHDPEVLAAQSIYEVWCPSGLSAEASEIIDTWPKRWKEHEVARVIKRLLRKPTFAGVSWVSIKKTVLEGFPKIISPIKREGIDISELVRARREILDNFFTVSRVVPISEVKHMFSEILNGSNWRQLTDVDVRHLVDRVETFAPDERLRFFSSFVLGIRSEVITEMSPDELKTFYGNILKSIHGNHEIILNVGLRKAMKLLSKHASLLVDKHYAFLYSMMEWLKFWVITRCTPYPDFTGRPSSEYQRYTIERQFRLLLDYVWDQRILKTQPGLDPDHAAPLTRIRQEFSSRQEFEHRVEEAFQKNLSFVSKVIRDLESFMPKQILVISDTMSVLDGEQVLLDSFSKTMEQLTPAEITRKKA